MELLDRLRKERFGQKRKRPLPPSCFAVVAAIVQKFGLTSLPAAGVGRGAGWTPPERLALFPLLTPEQYQLTQEIISRYDNPYLLFAAAPEDFALSQQLYHRNPHLAAAVFRENSLAALLAWE